MEATGIYWRPVWQVLAAEGSGAGRTLILANAAHVKNVPGRKTDVADAVWLSDLLAHGLIRASCRRQDARDARPLADAQAARASRLRARRGPRRAICAVAASMLTAAYHMLGNGAFYADPGPDHLRRSQPTTRAKALARQLERLGFTCSISPVEPVSI